MYTVYQHKNKINGKVYIGITMQEPEKRWGVNGCNYKSSPHFYSAIQKHGWDNFEHNILFTNLTKEEACLKEQELIKQFNSMDRNFGYNSTSGGEACVVNEETRQKISQALMGNKNGFGHPCSEEKKKKIGESQKGKSLQKNVRKECLKLLKSVMFLVLRKRDKNFHKTIQIKRKCIVRNLIQYLILYNNVVASWGYQQQISLSYVEEEVKLLKDTI